MENIEDELGEFRRMLADRFSGDPKIGTVAEGRRVMFLTLFALLCELEPLSGNKIITEAHHFDLEMLKSFLDSVNKRLVREDLAKRALGCKLHVGEIDDYEIEDISVQKDKVVVWLERKSLKVGS
ncbi:MAG: hypothetical protein FGF51_03630 [Candidatus Brockarchaeota archaeon]|nr:hypothetical protein [Candidatus Brockarchaeota archaeon]